MVVQYNGPHHNTQYKQNGSPLLEPGCQTWVLNHAAAKVGHGAEYICCVLQGQGLVLGNKVGDSGAEHLEHGGRVGIEHAHSVGYLIANFMFCTL